MDRKTIILTAFDAFGDDDINPSMLALEKAGIPDKNINLVKVKVNTVFRKAEKQVICAIDEYKPYAVICLGQAGGRKKITVERVAINIMDATIKDNEGNMPCDETICENSPCGYFSTLPIKKIVEDMNEKGIPAEISNSAGTFVCNYLMFSVLDYVAKNNLKSKVGFIHVPFIKEQLKNSDLPYMEIEDIVKGINSAILTVAES